MRDLLFCARQIIYNFLTWSDERKKKIKQKIRMTSNEELMIEVVFDSFVRIFTFCEEFDRIIQIRTPKKVDNLIEEAT